MQVGDASAISLVLVLHEIVLKVDCCAVVDSPTHISVGLHGVFGHCEFARTQAAAAAVGEVVSRRDASGGDQRERTH